MDMHVLATHKAQSSGLTSSERRRLENAQAEMPVMNPDGSMGISLHVTDDAPGAGALEESIVYDGPFPSLVRDHSLDGVNESWRNVHH